MQVNWPRICISASMVSECRISPPGSLHLVTRRTVQGQFLIRPDESINQNFLYCLGYASQKHGVDIHAASFLSNHSHIALTDCRGDCLPEFTRDFFSLTARSINAYHGRSESLWGPDRPNCVLLAPFASDVVDKLAYVITNPVEAELVSHSRKWPGVLLRPGDSSTEILEIERPEFFYRLEGDLPPQVSLRLSLPEVRNADRETIGQRLDAEVQSREKAIRQRVRAAGRSFLGAKAVKKRAIHSQPSEELPTRQLIPTVACHDRDLRKTLLEWKRARQNRYDELRKALEDRARELSSTIFPMGTYGLWRWYGFEREAWEGCFWSMIISKIP